jgi:uncharacterized protein YndB with AHSA1/START domain
MTVEQRLPSITITTPSDREIRFERTFNAPRDVVWSAFTDPSLISQWWGGGAEVDHMDVTFGGHMPDGSKFTFEGEYLEIDPPRLLKQTYVNGWMGGAKWIETLEFEDLGEQTRFTQTSQFDTTEMRDQVLPTVEQGAHFTYSRLDQVLAKIQQR